MFGLAQHWNLKGLQSFDTKHFFAINVLLIIFLINMTSKELDIFAFNVIIDVMLT